MATLDIQTTRPADTTSIPDGKAYFETSTNQFIVWDATDGEWIQLDSDGTGAVGYALDATRELSFSSAPVVHLDASELSLADGASVTSWTDKTSNGNNIAAVGTPLYYNSVYGGKAAIQLDLGDGFTDSSFFTNNDFSGNEATLFMVYIPTSSTGGDTSGFSAQSTFFGTKNENTDVQNFSSGSYPGAFVSSRMGFNYTSGELGEPSAGIRVENITVSQSDDTYLIGLDGGARLSTTLSGNGVTFAADAFSIGNTIASASWANYQAQGYIFEVLLFNKKLTDAEHNTVGSYLAAKYSASYTPSISFNENYELDSSYSTSVTPSFHFDANFADAIYNGTSVATDGDSVSSWVAKNGSTRFSMLTASTQPTYTASRTPSSATNTTKGLYFNGSQYLSLPNASSLLRYSNNPGNSLFVVMEPDNAGNWNIVAEGGRDYFRFGASSYANNFLTTDINNVSHNGLLRTSGIHLVGIYNNTSTTAYSIEENGSVVLSTSGISTKARPTQFGLADSYSSSIRLRGWVYEILYFPGELSSADKTSLLNYAKNKYGVS